MKYDKQIEDLIRKDITLEHKGISDDDKERKSILSQMKQLYVLQQKEKENERICKNN
jgi:orotate phosphoribosyltransferase-like protein